jgi:HK97 gp10 family phage protein
MVILMSVESLLKRLDAIPKEVRKAVEPALIKSGAELQQTMQHLAPVDSGALRESIAVTPPGHAVPTDAKLGGASHIAKENEVIVSAGNFGAFYARWVEFGTVKTPAQPFFFPAYRLLRARIQRRLKRAISKAIRDGWNKS